MFENKYGYQLDIEFKDGKKFRRKNMSKQQAIKECDRYKKEMLILNIRNVAWKQT